MASPAFSLYDAAGGKIVTSTQKFFVSAGSDPDLGYGNAPLWSSSYFVATTGSVSMDTVKSYIESQRTDEHKRKYEKRSKYWNS